MGSVHTTNAINAARDVKEQRTAEAKIDELARAVEGLAWALREIEDELRKSR